MIQSFNDKSIENFFINEKVPKGAGWVSVKKIVRRKLSMLDAALQLTDLKTPPGNSLESLKGNLIGYFSIRVNDQWRIIFKWPNHDTGPSAVDVVDYH